MLKLSLKPHRPALRADSKASQKLFAMLRAIPVAAATEAPVALALVVDTSGSMQGEKLERAIKAAHRVIDDPRLDPDDHLALVKFDSSAETLLSMAPLGNRNAAHRAADTLNRFSGNTFLAAGLQRAAEELAELAPGMARRVVVLTDGKAQDEENARSATVSFSAAGIPLIAIGIGDEYNEKLLLDLADITQGRPYHLKEIGQVGGILNAEVTTLVREVVVDLQATVKTVRGVALDGMARVYPSLSEVDTARASCRLGNLTAGEGTVFMLGFTVSDLARPPGRARIATIGLSGYAVGEVTRREMEPVELFAAFSTDEAAIAAIDPEVLGYVQQRNVDHLVQQAVRRAGSDPGGARQTLQTAMRLTRELGNPAITRMLAGAVDELSRTGTLSPGTRKTVSLGGRTQTVQVQSSGASPDSELPSEEEIRRLTGA